MINDVSRALTRWLEPIIGTEITGSFEFGRWVETETDIEFSGVIQNATPEDLKIVEEAYRTEESIKIHTVYQLIPFKTRVVYEGYHYLVVNVANRKIGNYYKAIAIKGLKTPEQDLPIGWDTPLADAWDTPVEDAWTNPLGEGEGETTLWNTPLEDMWDDPLEDDWDTP